MSPKNVERNQPSEAARKNVELFLAKMNLKYANKRKQQKQPKPSA